MQTVTSSVKNRVFIENVPVNDPVQKKHYMKNNGGENKQASYKTIYFCPNCKRAWQRVQKETEYFREWIIGDVDRLCEKCSKLPKK